MPLRQTYLAGEKTFVDWAGQTIGWTDWTTGQQQEAFLFIAVLGASNQYRLFLKILDDRQGTGATLLTSQYPVATWHQLIEDPTVGDAILDRLIHNAHNIELKGESMRKKSPQ